MQNLNKNDIIWVSPSKLKTLSECEQNFLGSYFWKLPETVHPKTRIGSLIHTIFECISDPKKPLKVQEHRKQLVLDSVKTRTISPILVRFLMKLLRQNDVPQDLYDLAHELTLDAFLLGFDVNYPVVAVEDYFEIKISEHVGIRGYIDKIIDVSDLAPSTCEAKDYKTGQPFPVDKCKEEFQPYFYVMAIKHKYDYKNVLFSFHFLKNHKTVHVDVSDEQLDKFKNKVIAEGLRIKKLLKNPETAVPTKNWKCDKFCNAKVPNQELGYKGCPLYYKDGKPLFRGNY